MATFKKKGLGMAAAGGGKASEILVHHDIPRTAASAKKKGFKKLEMSLHTLPQDEKKKWLIFSETSARGAICGVRPLPGGGVKICYIDPNTGECNDCHEG